MKKHSTSLFREVFNENTVKEISKGIKQAYPQFNDFAFESFVNKDLKTLSFIGRASLITEGLIQYLPDDFFEVKKILVDSLEPESKADELSGTSGFKILPLTMVISKLGINHPDDSLEALYEMTKRFTAENEIRPFLQKHPEKTLKFLEHLTSDPNPFARRLASEGTRPRLPMAPRLPEFQKDPTPIINILLKLRNDENLMVRRSVANNLNDISKDNPDVVINLLIDWKKEASDQVMWLMKHSLRTLLKQGNADALKLLGYDTNAKITVSNFIVDSSVLIGDKLYFSFALNNHANKKTKVMIDYVVYFVKANKKHRPKTFKLAKTHLTTHEVRNFSGSYSFEQKSTRKHYKGMHKIEIVVNGKSLATKEFNVS